MIHMHEGNEGPGIGYGKKGRKGLERGVAERTAYMEMAKA